MQRKFLSWLFVLICAAFTVAGGLAYLQFHRQAKARAVLLMSNRLHDLMLLIRFTQENMRHVEQINDATTLERTRALAEIIRLNPGIIDDQEALQGLCNDLGAKQLCISDEKGIIIAGVPASLNGYNLGQHEQSRPFLKCIKTPGTEIVQRPRSNGFSGQVFQYCGVSRPDAPGVVQLGFTPQHELMVRNSITFDKLARNIMGNTAGHIVAFRDGQFLNRDELNLPSSAILSIPLNVIGEINVGGKDYATYAIEEDGTRLVGFMPLREVNNISAKSLRYLLWSNIGLFVLMFIAVWWLLRRYVLKGLNRINHSLRRITEGYTEERVEVKDTPELIRLSTGINAMVESLQSYGEQKRERLNKELQLASAIQNTMLPHKFPAFPAQTAFDLYATSTQAQVVGGDFYDFFMPDSRHLCFLLGDVADTGIPAALFMMRAVSVIRELAKSGATPQKLVTKANKELCSGDSGMRLSLFYGRLNLSTGDLRFVNAGTPQALLRRPGSEYEMLAMNSGAVLGVHAGASYNECRMTLEPGDRLFLYTNGVINATDAGHTPFGTARLQEALRVHMESVNDVPLQVRTALQQFTGNMEQQSDCTMLALEFRGKWRSRLEINILASEAEQVLPQLQEKLESVFAAPSDISAMQTTVRQIMHALPPDTAVELQLQCNEQEAQLDFHYNQPHLNPLVSLPHLPIDRATYSTDRQHSSTLKLSKTLL